MSTERLAALLHDVAREAYAQRRWAQAPWPTDMYDWLAARLVAQGVRVGDDGPTILDAWRVLEREYPEATVDRLRAALAAPPAPPALDRERLVSAETIDIGGVEVTRLDVRLYRKTAKVRAGRAMRAGVIPTLEGDHAFSEGDYIAGPGAAGEFWPVRRDVFEATYEAEP